MKIHIIISLIVLIIAVIIFIVIRFRKINLNKNTQKIINVIGLCCGIISIFFFLTSYYISPNKNISQLYKLSMPTLIIILFLINLKKLENKK